jgi:hypothetical protein
MAYPPPRWYARMACICLTHVVLVAVQGERRSALVITLSILQLGAPLAFLFVNATGNFTLVLVRTAVRVPRIR